MTKEKTEWQIILFFAVMKSNMTRLTVGNPAGTIKLRDHVYQFYIPEFSRPTGKYAAKSFVRLMNAFFQRGSIAMLSNPCTPGIGLPELSKEQLEELRKNTPFRTVIINKNGQCTQDNEICFPAEPFMVVKIPGTWKSAEDYVGAMQSKYRVRTKKVYELSQSLKSTVYSGTQIPEMLFPKLAELLSQTLSKKTLALPPDLHGLLKAFAYQYAEQFEIEVYKDKDDKIIGFLSRIHLDKTTFALHIGYNADIARELHIYQRMMYDLIISSIQKGMTEVNLGRTATEIKSTLGAEPVGNMVMLVSNNPIIRVAARVYLKYFYKTPVYTIRKPFKA